MGGALTMMINSYNFPAPSAPSAPYWRAKVTATSSAYIRAAEIQMRATSGGTDQCTGGTALADSYYAPEGLTPDNAFDDNTLTDWASNGTGTNGWIGYHFPSSVSVTEVTWMIGNDASQIMTACDIQYSSDGSAWTTSWSESGFSTFGSGSVVTFNP